MSSSLGALSQLLQPLLEATEQESVAALVGRMTATIETFASRPGYKLTTIALHGWSEAQRNDRLRSLVRGYYTAFRDRLAERVHRWQDEGEVAADAVPREVAQLLLTTILGFVAQSALLGDATPAAHQHGLEAIVASRRSRTRRKLN